MSVCIRRASSLHAFRPRAARGSLRAASVRAVVCATLVAACSSSNDKGNGPSGDAGAPATGGTQNDAGSGGSSAAGAGGAASSLEAEPRFVGRVDASDPEAVRFAWSGTGVVARFEGTSVAVRLGAGQQYTVIVDGEVRPKLVSTGGSDPLASELPDGPHTVELYRRTEANQGESVFYGFDLGSGVLLAPPPAPERRIEIIGDSISAGYGNEGADMTCTFSPDTENHYLTYGALAARTLGAELSTIAWSGKGVVCNYGDEPTSCSDPLPTYYDRTLPDRAASQWSFGSFQPHAVVINLSTNDFSTAVDPTQADFEAAYGSLLERVRGVYPDAVILCTVGPMLNGADLTTARTYITNAVQARIAAGDTKLETFDLAPTNPADGYGCDYHPSLRTHEVMAETLTAALRAELGW